MEHGCDIEKMPWLWDSMPRPLQTGQTRGVVPGLAPEPWQVGHGCEVGTASGTCAPLTAWSKVSETSVSRSRPRGRPLAHAAAGPRRAHRHAATAAAAAEQVGEDVAEAAAERARIEAARRAEPPNGPPRSYALRLSASDRTSWACEISLKRSSAFLSPGLRSGWYWRASLR